MSAVAPVIAAVRPRALRTGALEPQLLEEIVAELIEEGVRRAVPLVGPPGSGKSTALAHLAEVFAADDRLRLADDPAPDELQRMGEEALWIFAPAAPIARFPITLTLQPWGLDELIEYLLAVHPQACGTVVERLGDAGRRAWLPELATVVLDRFADKPQAVDVVVELVGHIDEAMPSAEARKMVRRYCLAVQTVDTESLDAAFMQRVRHECGDGVRGLVRHAEVQLPLAAERAAWALSVGSTAELNRRLPRELVDAIAERCRAKADARRQLQKSLKTRAESKKHPMVASLLYAIDRRWAPPARLLGSWNFAGGYFSGADWQGVVLSGAHLERADLSGARLQRAILTTAHLDGAAFDGAQLDDAALEGAQAIRASFGSATLKRTKLANALLRCANFANADLTGAELLLGDLVGADLTGARFCRAHLTRAMLTGARLADADFSGATLYGADMKGLDLRFVRLDGASLAKAALNDVQLEDVTIAEANFEEATLRGAHLTGSIMPGANFRGADLSHCGLAEIHWEGADLRDARLAGATFHMGSSRSGLVGSPIACEGSKTGFYTDDYEDMHFKLPEEVRKANLRGADLRGANIDGLDFYLVDLREARLERRQLEHVRRCGAILEDVVA
jgi:uncharacterized protein YjbI with pentapeptide repeats